MGQILIDSWRAEPDEPRASEKYYILKQIRQLTRPAFGLAVITVCSMYFSFFPSVNSVNHYEEKNLAPQPSWYINMFTWLRERLNEIKKGLFLALKLSGLLHTGPKLELKRGPLLAHVNSALSSLIRQNSGYPRKLTSPILGSVYMS